MVVIQANGKVVPSSDVTFYICRIYASGENLQRLNRALGALLR